MQSILLGVLQGLTEFLPVSSSGHLVLGEHLFGIALPQTELQRFDVILHAGTLLAILLCYAPTWKKLLLLCVRRDARSVSLLAALLVGTIPAAVAGLLFEDMIAETFRTPKFVGAGFLLTGAILLLSERLFRSIRAHPRISDAILIGCAQALALLPGVSRSGMTIAAGRATGLDRSGAVDFSFLLAAPIIAGATLLTIRSFLQGGVGLPSPDVIMAGFFSSLVASVAGIAFIRRWVRTRSIGWFAAYLFPVGLAVLFFL